MLIFWSYCAVFVSFLAVENYEFPVKSFSVSFDCNWKIFFNFIFVITNLTYDLFILRICPSTTVIHWLPSKTLQLIILHSWKDLNRTQARDPTMRRAPNLFLKTWRRLNKLCWTILTLFSLVPSSRSKWCPNITPVSSQKPLKQSLG